MNFLRNMKLSKKLIIAFIITSLISGILTGVSAILGINAINSTGQEIYEQNIVPLTPAHNAYVDILNVRINLKLLAVCDESSRESTIASTKTMLTTLDTDVGSYSQDISSQEERENCDKLQADLVDWKPYVTRFMELVEADNMEEAMTIPSDETLIALETEIDGLFDSAFTLNSTQASSRQAENQETGKSAQYIIYGIILLAIIISILFGIMFARMISVPIKAVAEAAHAIEMGIINNDVINKLISINQKDEVGMLAGSMRKAVGSIEQLAWDSNILRDAVKSNDLSVDVDSSEHNGIYKNILDVINELFGQLRATISTISVISSQVSSGAELVSNGAQTLAMGATEQASSIEELATAVTNISKDAQNNVDNVKVCSNYIELAGTGVQNCNKDMNQLLSAMNEINESSNQISSIIKIIDDISFQTNILALNAAVEAARAGTAGKGFAVVAEEVRTLASRSAQAASQTSSLIQSSITSIARGTKLAETTAASLENVLDNTNNVVDSNDKFTSSSNAQAAAINEIKQVLNQISQVVQNNSATAEESAAASEELSAQAQNLNAHVSKFKLK